jgi:NADH-quinone oxidoreductase subunit J
VTATVTAAPLMAAASTDMAGGEAVMFWIVGPIMVLAALGLLFARKAVHAALGMALVMVLLGIVYLAQDAPFLGAVQVFVYTGAVMMVFLFVLMLIGVDSGDSLVETIRGQRAMGILFSLGLGVLLVGVLWQVPFGAPVGLEAVNEDGNITALAEKIFGTYVWAFELTGALLITAVLGAMILAHRELPTPRPTQTELARNRISSGPVKAPLPAPGVFARHNAVDTPALLPDGTPCEESVSRVLRARGQRQEAEGYARTTTAISARLASPLDGPPDPGDDPQPGHAEPPTGKEGESQ